MTTQKHNNINFNIQFLFKKKIISCLLLIINYYVYNIQAITNFKF